MPSTATIQPYYSPGRYLLLNVNGSEENFIITQAFTPTNSQVVVARPLRDIPRLRLSSTTDVILKIYDHAVISYRGRRHPLNVNIEAALTKSRKDPHVIKMVYETPDCDDEETWEEWYFRRMQLIAWEETQAYQRLVPFQGNMIPFHYGSAELELQKIAGRTASVQVAILEYVRDASDLKDTPKAKITDTFQQSLLEAAKAFGRMGVIHGDLDAHNILFAPSYAPTRVVIIDFGMAHVKEDGETQAEWETYWDSDWEYLTSCLRWKMTHATLP